MAIVPLSMILSPHQLTTLPLPGRSLSTPLSTARSTFGETSHGFSTWMQLSILLTRILISRKAQPYMQLLGQVLLRNVPVWTGMAEMTSAYNLPARRVIHTVGPKYVEKYHSAAENALSRCYLSCLELLIENNLSSIAFGCICTEAKGYPREKAAHVALCTVRRFLEKHEGRISALIFCPTTAVDIAIYERLMWMYFPRTKLEEQNALILLPVDIQDENGEIVTVERQIRIKELPGASELVEGFRSPAPKDVALPHCSNRRLSLEECIIDPLFLSMVEDPDSRRQEQWKRYAKMHGSWILQQKKTQGQYADKMSEDAILYHRYLARAKAVDLSEAADLKILYRSGLDVEGRPVMVVVGAHFLLRRLDMEQFILYVIKEFEPLIHRQYTVVYFHSAAALQLRSSWSIPRWV